MNAFMIHALYLSCAMALAVLVYAFAAVLLRKRYSAKTFYYAGILVLLGFLIPFRPRLSIPAPTGSKSAGESVGSALLQRVLAIPNPGIDQAGIHSAQNAGLSPISIIFAVWLLGAFLVLLYHIIRHIYFIKTVNRWSVCVTEQTTLEVFHETKRKLGIAPHIELQTCSCITTPMLVRLPKPAILLPDFSLSEEDLRLVLSHELIHFKRKDLLFKGLLMLAASIYWYNPAVYLFAKLFTHFCELSCDEAVTEKLSENAKYQYAMLILRSACRSSAQATVFSTFFYGGKENMKIRITSVMCTAKKRFGILLLAVCFLVTLGAGTVFTVSDNHDKAGDKSGDDQPYFYDIKTEEEIALDIEKAFSEEFDPAFDESDFPEMIITYDDAGIPTVTDPDTIPVPETVTARTRRGKNGFYSSSDCSESSLVFYLSKNQAVEVSDSAPAVSAAKVKFAGSGGYMKKSDLKF